MAVTRRSCARGPDPDGSGPGVPPRCTRPTRVETIVADAGQAEVSAPTCSAPQPLGRHRRRRSAGAARGSAGGTDENRGGESTLGNLVAEVQRWATEPDDAGGAQIAFMNPGGLRADLIGTRDGYPRR